jgi:hypothetical protein
VLTARQLLEAMLVPSGCDAAYLLATAYGPGRAAFIREMNATAQSLGLGSTHFSSFDGMPFPTEHSTYSSPANLIKLGEAAMKYRLFRKIVRQRSYLVHGWARHHHRYYWTTTNLLLSSYRGTLGIKTGSTQAAGDCLLFEARRGSRSLIGVVLVRAHGGTGRRPGHVPQPGRAGRARLASPGHVTSPAPRASGRAEEPHRPRSRPCRPPIRASVGLRPPACSTFRTTWKTPRVVDLLPRRPG